MRQYRFLLHALEIPNFQFLKFYFFCIIEKLISSFSETVVEKLLDEFSLFQGPGLATKHPPLHSHLPPKILGRLSASI